MTSCLVCGASNAIRFGLTVSVDRGRTSRGAGAIRLCERCWRLGTNGHRYIRREGYCRNRIHPMVGDNIATGRDGRVRCRECHRAQRDRQLSRMRLKTALRGGTPWPEERRRKLSETVKAKARA